MSYAFAYHILSFYKYAFKYGTESILTNLETRSQAWAEEDYCSDVQLSKGTILIALNLTHSSYMYDLLIV